MVVCVAMSRVDELYIHLLLSTIGIISPSCEVFGFKPRLLTPEMRLADLNSAADGYVELS